MQNITFEESFEIVKSLVNDFQSNLDYYTSKEYPEARVRQDFLDKFFIALGWDVLHQFQKNPYEQEVKIERSMQIGDNPKFADYAFCLAPEFRSPRFLVEAKKPSHNLYNADYYFQTIRYAWNKQNPIVILTDFEEFHILDSRYKPDIETALQRKIKQYRFTEYADEEKFRHIFHLFSREDVSKNSIEKYGETLKKPPGKAVQKTLFAMGGVQPVDETFLADLDEYRKTLASSFKKTNSSLNSVELTEAVQRTLDRLIFIRFLEDKLIENEHYVSEFGDKSSSWQAFINISRKLDLKYNGIVFKPHLIDGKNNFNPPDDRNFSDICDELSHINSPYLFNLIPVHILGSIYERFLGKIVVSKGRGIAVEEKPEVRKAGGVYYTPQYIVEYIVNNTVSKLVEGKTPKEISKLRFADIACGSGSFLITVFDALLKYHGKYYNENPEQAKKDGCRLIYNLKDESFFDNESKPDKIFVLSLNQKCEILKNNIYGVDIDSQAVEVTQVSLFLKLLEDETPATANETWNLFGKKEALLPNLEKNIICGNSLIGSDIYDGKLLYEDSPVQTDSFNKTTENFGKVSDKKLSKDEEVKINALDFVSAFPFLTNSGGFDALVGNPPWGQKEVIFSYLEKEYLKLNYPSSSVGILDLFRFFIERTFKLLKFGSYFGLVLPDIILLKNYESTRKFILDNYEISYIDIWGMAFKDVNLDSCSLICKKDIKKQKNNIIQVNVHTKDEISTNLIPQSLFSKLDGLKFNVYLDNSSFDLLESLKQNKKFSDFMIVREGIHSGNVRDKLFLTEQENKYCKKLIFGRDEVSRFFLKWNGKWVDYRNEIIDKKKNEYAGLGKKEYYETDKIVIRRTGDYVLASVDTNNYYFSNNFFVCIPNEKLIFSLYYLLGILNSELMTWYYLTLQPRKGKLFSEIKINLINTFPIKEISAKNKEEIKIHDEIVNITLRLIEIKKNFNELVSDKEKDFYNRQFESNYHTLNNLVFKLYNLNNNQIEIIKNSFRKE